MRKVLILAALTLALAAGTFSPRAEARAGQPCQICETCPNGFQCCTPCLCFNGVPFTCALSACVCDV